MSDHRTLRAHHASCAHEYAWDVASLPEVNAACTCPRFWPRLVCAQCLQSMKRHAKTCPSRAYNDPVTSEEHV